MTTELRFPAPQRLADRTTVLLREYWYVAALSSEVDRTLRERWFLDESVVLFRREDGRPVALQNRCAHRSFPLAKSTLSGDIITCGYHGIAFDSAGRCVGVPCQDTVPTNLAVKSYPLVERAPFVWIWLGEPESADPALVPHELSFFADPAWTTAVHGYFNVKCNYLSLHENLLDLTHFPFLHGEKAGSIDYARAPFEVTADGDRVIVKRIMTEGRLAAARAEQLGINPAHAVNQTSESVFVSPALHVAHSHIEDREGGKGSFRSEIVHAVTPASQHETHYFWVSARNFALDDKVMNEVAFRRSQSTFLEDVDALEWIEDIYQHERRPGFHEISVRGDKAGLRMRTVLARLAQRQADHVTKRDGGTST